MAVADAPATDFDPYGTQGESSTVQESDYAPAGGGPPTEQLPAPEPEPEVERVHAAPKKGALAPKREAKKSEHRDEPLINPTGAPAFFGGAKPDAESTPAEPGAEAPAFFNGVEDEPAPPPAPVPPPAQSAAHIAAMGIGDYIDKMAIGGGKIAGGLAVIGDKIKSMFGPETTAMQDAWFKHIVDPYVARDAEQKLPADASLKDRAIYGVSNTAAMIASFFIGGELAGGAEGGSALTAHLASGAAGAAVPAFTQATDIGQSVLDATGNKTAAAKAAVMAYLSATGAALVPAAIGGGALAKIGSGAAIGGATGEAQRRAQNAMMPEDMQEPFDPLNATLNIVAGGGFGAAAHLTRPGEARAPRQVVEAGPSNAIEAAELDARRAVAAQGGDPLDQQVAASHVAAHIGGVHDAAAVQAAREAEQLANMRETQRQQAEQADADNQADIDQGTREQALNQVEATKAPKSAPEQGFAAREAEQAKQKEADFAAAKNQQGEQAVEAAKTEEIGAEKGGANEPKPTLAEALPPEQLAALQSLKARRQAAGAEPTVGGAHNPTVAERLEAQNPEDNFQKLGPEVAPKAENVPLKAPKPTQEAIKSTEEPPEPGEEEEPSGKGPPPATAQTLAQRRQAAIDAAMAAKVRGEPVKNETTYEQVAEPNKLETAQPNRLAAIRAAAERKRPPLQQEFSPDENILREKVRQDMGLPPEEPAKAGEPAQENRPQPVETREQRATRLEKLRDDYNESRITKEQYDAARTTKPAALAERRNPGMVEDMTTSLAMPHDEAKEHLSPLSDAAGPRTLQIHKSASADSVPKDLQATVASHEAKVGRKVKGVYENGVAHVFADAHETGDKEGITLTAVHELTHKGVAAALGGEGSARYQNVLQAIGEDIKDTSWAKKYAARRQLDPTNGEHLAALANEYVAHMAENVHAGREVNKGLPVTSNSPSHWRQIKDAIRTGLREIGLGRLVGRWTDDDVAAFIRRAQSHVGGDPIGAARTTLFSDEPTNKGKYSDAADWGHTAESQRPKGYKEPMSDKAKEAFRNVAAKSLKLSFLHNLPDVLNARTRPLMPSPQRFIETHDRLEATRGKAQAEGAKVADRWQQNVLDSKDGGENLFNTMHNSTLLRQDPTKPYESKYTENKIASDPKAAEQEAIDKRNYEIAKKQYNTLSPEEKKLYAEVRDHYSKMLDNEMGALEKRIGATDAAPALKEKYISLLRKQFEPSGHIAPYFPLGRGEGDFWGVARDADGKNVSFVKVDSASQLRAWRAEAEKSGFTSEGGQNMDLPSERRQLNPKFASEVADMARDVSPAFAEDVWQHYLRSMPEVAGVKRGLPRIGRLGYTQDALHTFKVAVSRHSMMLARLEHSQKMADLVESMKAEAHDVEMSPKTTDADKAMAPALAKEFAERAELISNPKGAGWLASHLTRLGYAWYLWWSPSTIYRIWMQNPMLARPLIAKHFGGLGATRELSTAVGEWAKYKGTQGYIDSLRGDERTWAEDAQHTGVISNTWAKTLMSGGPRPAGEVGQPQAKSPFMRGASAAINSGGWMFNAIEKKNRITTFMAAYRLGVKNGMAPEAAASRARSIVRDAHVDYSLVGRPSILQKSDIARVVGQFKLYPAQVAYRLFREFRDMTRMDGGITPGQRLQATRALSSIAGRAMLLGGVNAVPGYWLASGLVNAYMHQEGDDSFDMTQSIKQHLTALLGSTGARTIMHGPASVASGYNLSSAAEYNHLFYKSSEEDKNWKGTMGDILAQLGGSPAGLALGAAQGADIATGPNANLERGAEAAAPTELANLLKANRFWREGALNMRGEPIIPREDIGTPQAVFRALGLTPEKLLEQQEANTAFENAKKRILDHKMTLENALERAGNEGDSARQAELLTEIQQFNEANRGNHEAQITMRGVARSMRSRAIEQATAVGGLNTKGFEGLAQEFQ